METYCRYKQATDGNTTHAHCVLDIRGYKQTLRIRNNCFYTATVVARTRLNVTL